MPDTPPASPAPDAAPPVPLPDAAPSAPRAHPEPPAGVRGQGAWSLAEATALLGPGHRAGTAVTPFGVYVHIPFCSRRCGYCDFNTYTHADGVDSEGYITAVLSELDLIARAMGDSQPPRVDTVFFGGGTPTLLPPQELARVLTWLDRRWGLTPHTEITTEANPETVSPATLRDLVAAGFTRISLGAQSTAPHVLATLDRQHTPGRPVEAIGEARDAGFAHLSLDLIYGTPGERPEDLAASVTAAVESGVDHVSAYALVVEEGTSLARRVRRGEVAPPDDDVEADRYLAADELLTAAGFRWYEISNWATEPAARCRHNLGYWHGADWLGLGPGAHGHRAGTRWWNTRHPRDYRRLLAGGQLPTAGWETLTPDDRHLEAILLGIRLAEGLDLGLLPPPAHCEARTMVAEGLLLAEPHSEGRAVLTRRGRLLADTVVHRLLPR